jgi:hypothetical protein
MACGSTGAIAEWWYAQVFLRHEALIPAENPICRDDLTLTVMAMQYCDISRKTVLIKTLRRVAGVSTMLSLSSLTRVHRGFRAIIRRCGVCHMAVV